MGAIRIVHIIHDMEVGGAQRQVLNLFRAVDRSRFDMRLVCLGRKGAFGEALEAEGFLVEALGKSARADLPMLGRLAGLLRAWRPDIVHCTIYTANLWGRVAAMLARVPVRIAHEQSTVSLERWHRRWVDNLLSLWTHRVLVVSEDLRRRVIAEEHLVPRRVEVLHNAIDVAAIRDAATQPAPDLPGEAGFRVGVVGRIEPRKDHLTLVRAAALVRERVPRATFLLAGDGPDRGVIESEIARLGLQDGFILLGERSDVPRLLHAFDVYALSSVTEGLSLSILEAMAAGLPVVATRVGGNPELLDEGRAGRLAPPGDADALADTLTDMLQNREEARRLGEGARVRAQGFDIRAIARQLEAIYECSLT